MMNIAYIDGANLYTEVIRLGWRLDYERFRYWLLDKYKIQRAYIFLGYVKGNESLYLKLEKWGFKLIFKEVTFFGGVVKGNCDTDLVLKAAEDFYTSESRQVILVSSDGDYVCLVKFFQRKNVDISVMSPSNLCSIFIKRTNVPILYIDTQKNILARK